MGNRIAGSNPALSANNYFYKICKYEIIWNIPNAMFNHFEQKKKLVFLFFKIYHKMFSEKFNKKINYNFDKTKWRLDLLNTIIKKKKIKNYLEIGCDQNQVFNLIDLENKVGVDPASGGNFRGTSDEFFKKNNNYFDCIFIDGLHEYEQVKRDIDNSLKYLNSEGYIILHDTLPDKISAQYVPRCRYKWNGDVWKAVVEIRTLPDYETFTCLIDQGVTIIQKKKNTDILKINEKFKNLKFKFFYENYTNLMRVRSYEEILKILDI